mgnify:CR=1 FL=1
MQRGVKAFLSADLCEVVIQASDGVHGRSHTKWLAEHVHRRWRCGAPTIHTTVTDLSLDSGRNLDDLFARLPSQRVTDARLTYVTQRLAVLKPVLRVDAIHAIVHLDRQTLKEGNRPLL